MDFGKLSYFAAIVEEKNLTRAAKRLFVSQPALSKSLVKVEEEMGCELFERRGRQMILNQAGEILYEFARETLDRYDDALRRISESRQKRERLLRIAASGIYYSESIVCGFVREYPQWNAESSFFPRSEFPKIVFRKDVDCVLSSVEMRNPDVICREIYSEPMLLAVHERHPLAGRKTFRMEDLRDEPLIFAYPDNLYLENIQNVYRQAGIELKFKQFFPKEFLLGAVSQGLGNILAAESSIATYRGNYHLLYPEDDFCRRSIYLIYRTDHMTPTLADFIQYIQTYIPAKAGGSA